MTDQEMDRILADPNASAEDNQRVAQALLQKLEDTYGQTIPPNCRRAVGWCRLDDYPSGLRSLPVLFQLPVGDERAAPLADVAPLGEQLVVTMIHGHEYRATGYFLPDDARYDHLPLPFIELVWPHLQTRVLPQQTVGDLRRYFYQCQFTDQVEPFIQQHCVILFYLPSDIPFPPSATVTI